ncbi:hypothetical protein pb186bvf_019869 [Paramecium bursaria]
MEQNIINARHAVTLAIHVKALNITALFVPQVVQGHQMFNHNRVNALWGIMMMVLQFVKNVIQFVIPAQNNPLLAYHALLVQTGSITNQHFIVAAYRDTLMQKMQCVAFVILVASNVLAHQIQIVDHVRIFKQRKEHLFLILANELIVIMMINQTKFVKYVYLFVKLVQKQKYMNLMFNFIEQNSISTFMCLVMKLLCNQYIFSLFIKQQINNKGKVEYFCFCKILNPITLMILNETSQNKQKVFKLTKLPKFKITQTQVQTIIYIIQQYLYPQWYQSL